jgi:hypothetical protein
MTRALLLVLLALAACSRPADEGGESASPAPPPTVDSAPAAAAPTDATPVWKLDESGIGPVRVGMTIDEARAALGGDFTVDEPLNGGPDDCRYGRSGAAPEGVLFMLEQQRIVRVDVTGPGPETTLGARIGDSQHRVGTLYGQIRTEPHKYTDGRYLTVIPRAPADTLHRIVFETDSAGVVERFRGGLYPPVFYVEGCA